MVSTRNAKVIVVGTEESETFRKIGTTIETDVIGVDTTERVIEDDRLV